VGLGAGEAFDGFGGLCGFRGIAGAAQGFASGDDGHGGQAGVGSNLEVVVGVQVVAGGAPGVPHELGGGAGGVQCGGDPESHAEGQAKGAPGQEDDGGAEEDQGGFLGGAHGLPDRCERVQDAGEPEGG